MQCSHGSQKLCKCKNVACFEGDDVEESKLTSETWEMLLCAFISPRSIIKILSLGLISPSFIPLYTLLNGLGLILFTCKMALPSGVTVARDRATHNYLSRFSIASDVQLLTTYKTIDHELSYFASD